MSHKVNENLMKFFKESPTAFHATSNMRQMLDAQGFQALDEAESWSLSPGGKYYVTRNDSALIAFKLSRKDLVSGGVKMIGAHTDSPALKVKPNPENRFKNYLSVAVEPYGGLLLATWFDRDLSLAGRVTFSNDKGEVKSRLLNFERPIATVPSIAIHLDRTANDGRTINKQRDLPPILLELGNDNKELSYNDLLISELEKNGGERVKQVLDSEMFFYDTQPPSLIGFNEDYLASARIDNLFSCFMGIDALASAGDDVTALVVCNDHEECGSNSTTGAGGQFLKAVLERIAGTGEDYYRFMAKSYLISADNAHAVHPNASDKHDSNHAPELNMGPVIKINANQRYATNSETAAMFISCCQRADVPIQKFVARSDMGCGSTIGPLTSTAIGVKTIDIGIPTLGMHSVRELMGAKDACYLERALKEYFKS